MKDRRRKKPFALGYASGARCAHCRRPVRQLYMLHDQVWRRAVDTGGYTGLAGTHYLGINLHVGCVERLLGRRLRSRDFYFQDADVRR